MRRALRRFLGSDEGSASVEFVMWFPLFWAMFMWSFEQGVYLIRQVSLDRAVDLTVREVRLGEFDPVLDPADSPVDQSQALHDAVKDRVCEYSFMIPDCEDNVKLEMRNVDPRNWAMLGAEVDCVDRTDPGRPANAFAPGQSNDLMVLRACALFDPYFPATGLGARLEKVSDGAYALVSVSSFAVEPE